MHGGLLGYGRAAAFRLSLSAWTSDVTAAHGIDPSTFMPSTTLPSPPADAVVEYGHVLEIGQ